MTTRAHTDLFIQSKCNLIGDQFARMDLFRAKSKESSLIAWLFIPATFPEQLNEQNRTNARSLFIFKIEMLHGYKVARKGVLI